MSSFSARMVSAAQANDWDELVSLEKNVSSLRDTLTHGLDVDPLSSDEIQMKRTLIRRILDDDAEIRRHTEPWMENVRQFLEGAVTRRKVEHAYRL
ncbi:MAG: flagellar protein FliT [Rhodocyclaceae bacterium]|nr:flagellar protein FliT [Rhodocyclaceae bacterium]